MQFAASNQVIEMNMPYGQREYNRTMSSRSVVHVRIPRLMDAATYLSLVVMSLLAIRGLETFRSQLIFLGLGIVCGLLYRFVFRTSRYEKNPSIYFGSQLVVMSLMLILSPRSMDAINFIFLIVGLHAALVLNHRAAALWLAVYYCTVAATSFIRSGPSAYYAASFYLVAYVVIGFFGYILQQEELAREHNLQLVEELESTQKRLRDLAVVEERNRLARELHDSVKQEVFAISMQLSAARTSLSEADKAYTPVVEAERLAQQAGAELTTLINALRPPGLGSKTLPVAVREYVEEWSRQSGIESEVKIESTVSIDSQKEQALFRILQEALANVARHSKANKVLVTLEVDSAQIQLGIEDDGIGVETEKVIKGIGLNSMQERIETVDGTLQVSSRSPRGTRITARVRRS